LGYSVDGRGRGRGMAEKFGAECLMFRAFFLGFDTFFTAIFYLFHCLRYSFVSLKIILFPLFLPSPFSFFLSPPQNAIIGFFGSSRGGLFGILFKGFVSSSRSTSRNCEELVMRKIPLEAAYTGLKRIFGGLFFYRKLFSCILMPTTPIHICPTFLPMV